MARLFEARRFPRSLVTWRRLAVMAVAAFGITQLASLRQDSVSEEALTAGQTLFTHEWQPDDPLAAEGDGLGPVFNAKSCVACHFQGGVGGAGPNKHNVRSFEAHPTPDRPNVVSGVIHAFALEPQSEEKPEWVHQLFPVVKGGTKVIGGCQITFKDFDPVHFHEVNTPALFGAGLIDQISDGSISRNVAWRTIGGIAQEVKLDFNTTAPGRARLLPDGRIGKFGWKGQFATLEEFVATACAVEVGLTNPLRKQQTPKQCCEDGDAKLDLDQRQFAALVAYIEHLPKPEIVWPSDPQELKTAKRGEQLFTEVGCAECHTPNLGSTEGVYSDFCLHRMDDENKVPYGEVPPVPPPSDHPLLDEWKTPPLWGVADTAPYWHDGSIDTLEAAIQRHGGHGRHSREKFRHLKYQDQQAVVAFLKTMRCPGPTIEPTPVNSGEYRVVQASLK